MTVLEEVQRTIEALGPDNDAIAAIAQNGPAQWAVAFDEDTIITLDFVAEQKKLVLTIDLGRPEPGKRLAIYETLLSYNVLWPETGGVKMGVGGSGGEVVQMFELNAVDLDRERLQTVLEGFALKAQMWRRFVADGPAEDGAPGVDSPPEFMIRV